MASPPTSTRMRSPAAQGPRRPARAWRRPAGRRPSAAARRKRQLAQGGQVLELEEVVRRQPRGLGHIDLALGQPLAQLVGGDVDQLDLVGPRQGAVGHGLALAHAGDAARPRRPGFPGAGRSAWSRRRCPAVQQFLDVLPALGMARAGRVGMGVFVDQQQAPACGARAVSRSNSSSMRPRCSIGRRGQDVHARATAPRSRARPWVSTTPTSTSPALSALRRRAARSISKVLPTPGRHAQEHLQPAAFAASPGRRRASSGQGDPSSRYRVSSAVIKRGLSPGSDSLRP